MFTTHIENSGLIYHTAKQMEVPALAHGFSTRSGGVSRGIFSSMNLGHHRGDDFDSVLENYRIFCDALGVDVNRTVFAKQVHRDDVKIVTESDAGCGLFRQGNYEADALVTNVPGITLVVFSADCIPVLLYDPVSRCIGAAHSGWRGTALGIVAKTAKTMCEVYGARSENILAAIGPGISKCCFETNADVPEAMCAALGTDAQQFMTQNGEKWNVDLKAICAHWLKSVGVKPENISISTECTCCKNDLYWSHRKVGDLRGSQAAFLSLR